ncbi:hypothetical protein N7478_011356 [Penicillium angulare]|uniref:uncharacterized protein n=1 Tax=Penicillium angulare TaxID=116970 RepID=UPI0025413743|nr:uncharacterized protein N7478_011356 [Penicillium angulare]KAJ5263751.1 hypothetical protein N7478_011356 [Penicillium angulare]
MYIRQYEHTCPPRTGCADVIQEGSLSIKPVFQSEDSSFGAEVFGVDWSEPISDTIVAQLIALQDKYGVLIFRETGLDNARHIAFSQKLGDKLEINPFFYGRENDRLGEPLLFDVANIELDGSLDSSYHQQRSKYSILLSHVEGGSWTHFADMRRAYSDLPQATKDQIEDLVIEHDLWHSRKLASPAVFGKPLPHELAAKPPAFHRLVQVAPDGRKTLYLAAHAKRVLGMDLERSQKLIWELIGHCTQSKYVFSMEWVSAGDMVWWDNRQSMHRANPYTEHMTARDVRRSTILDDGSLAFGATLEEQAAAEKGGVN